MSHSRKFIVPALMVLGLFAAAPFVIGFEDASAGGHHHGGMGANQMNGGGQRGDGKNGDNGNGKNGGGESANGKNGGGDNGGNHGRGNNGDSDSGNGKNGGGDNGDNHGHGGYGGNENGGGGENGGDNGGNHGRGGYGGNENGGGGGYNGGGENGGGDNGGNHGRGGYGRGENGGNHGRGEGMRGHHVGRPQNAGTVVINNDFGFVAESGSSMSYGGGNITCVVDGHVIPVRSLSECRYGPGYVHNGNSYFGGNGGFDERDSYGARRILRYRNSNYGAVYGSYGVARARHAQIGYRARGNIAFSYGDYGMGSYVGSPAAVMQAHRRTRGVQNFDQSGGYDAGYYGGYDASAGGSYAGDMGYGYGRKIRARRHRHAYGMMGGYAFGAQGGCDCGSYNPGYVVHYGPTISKDGGY